MRVPARFLSLMVLLSAQGALQTSVAQEAGDICPLAVRLSSARASRSCVDLRRLPLPAMPTVDASDRWALVPFRSTGSYRSAYPADRNNGVHWAGRGLSSAVSGGLRVRFGRVTLSVEPELAWAQNLGFALPDTTTPGLSRFSYPWGTAVSIDSCGPVAGSASSSISATAFWKSAPGRCRRASPTRHCGGGRPEGTHFYSAGRRGDSRIPTPRPAGRWRPRSADSQADCCGDNCGSRAGTTRTRGTTGRFSGRFSWDGGSTSCLVSSWPTPLYGTNRRPTGV
mgnify:CR=1 FL=1